jgi:hypothetical protein
LVLFVSACVHSWNKVSECEPDWTWPKTFILLASLGLFAIVAATLLKMWCLEKAASKDPTPSPSSATVTATRTTAAAPPVRLAVRADNPRSHSRQARHWVLATLVAVAPFAWLVARSRRRRARWL